MPANTSMSFSVLKEGNIFVYIDANTPKAEAINSIF